MLIRKSINLKLLLIILLIPSVMGFGSLDTARIGMELNLSESDIAMGNLSISNPTNEIIYTLLTPSNLSCLYVYGADTKYELVPILLGNTEVRLFPGESAIINFSAQIKRDCEYEGQIGVTFWKDSSKNKVTLNSIIQVLAYGNKTFKNAGNFYIIMVSVLVLGFLVSVYLYQLLKGGKKYEKTNSDISNVGSFGSSFNDSSIDN